MSPVIHIGGGWETVEPPDPVGDLYIREDESGYYLRQDSTGYYEREEAAAAPLAVEATASSVEASLTASHSHTLPAGVQAGDLLIAALRTGRSRVIDSPPAGWTELMSMGVADNAVTYIYYRVADGSDALSFGTDGTCKSACVMYRISGAATGEASFIEGDGFVDATNHDEPDLPSVTPSWGSAETLWIAFAAILRGTTTFTSPPTNYGSIDEQISTDPVSTDTEDISVGCAHRFNEAATEDPGVFSVDAPDGRNRPSAATIAVRPS